MEKVRVYDKLVRDNIPDIIKKNDGVPYTRILNDEEYRRELIWKLKEECNEVEQATTKEQLIEELADVLEVLKALAKVEGKSIADVIEVAQEKHLTRGGFEKKVYLEKVLVKEKK